MQPQNLQQQAMRKAMIESLEQGGTEPRTDPVRAFRDGDEWRCHSCSQDKFGVVVDGSLQVQYRQRFFEFSAPEGFIRVKCRNCQTLNVLNMSLINVKITQLQPSDATEGAIELAQEHGINIDSIQGTGKDGKVQVNDVKRVIKEREDDLKARVVSESKVIPDPQTNVGMPPAEVQRQVPDLPESLDDGFIEIDSGG